MTDLLQESWSSAIPRGSGRLVYARQGERTVVTEASSASPLRLLTPRSAPLGAWAYTSNYGGGLLAGDHLCLDLLAEANTTCYLTTQSSTKIYKSPDGIAARQSLSAKIEEGAFLACCPDPLVCFDTAVYQQEQRFELAPGASLVLLDWFTSGRHATGERWKFSLLESRNRILVNGKPILEDILRLDPGTGPLGDSLRMGAFNCFATLIIVGPGLARYATDIHTSIASAPITRITPNRDLLLFASSPLSDGVIIRAAGTSTETVAHWLREKLQFLADIFGEHPWQRKW